MGVSQRLISAGRRLAAIVPAWLVAAALTTSFLAPAEKALVAAVLLATLYDPAIGLLVIASFWASSGAAFGTLARFQLTQAITLAFLAAWLLRPWRETHYGPAPPLWSQAAAWLSIGWLVYETRRGRLAIVDAGVLLEGIGLAVAAITIFRRRPALSRELPAGLAIGALGVGGPAAAMVLCLAIGMAGREAGMRRAIWLAAIVALALTTIAGRESVVQVHPLGLSAAALVLLALWMTGPLLEAFRALARSPRDLRLAGALTGLIVWAAAARSVDALGAPQIAFPFWLQFGLTAGLASSAALTRQPAR